MSWSSWTTFRPTRACTTPARSTSDRTASSTSRSETRDPARNAQNLRILPGKILRINADGSVPADNPFVGRANVRPEIWAYGLRNPFTFAFQPGTGRMFINDVGNATWEEVDEGARGANYGWPTCEGACSNPNFVNPIYTYNHAAGPGKAITGAVFYNGSQFPPAYANRYFFGDYVGNYIKTLDPVTRQVSDFATNAPFPVDLRVGPDGALYYLSVENHTISRIAFGQGPSPTPLPGSGEVSLTPTADDHVASAQPATNYGGSPELVRQLHGPHQRRLPEMGSHPAGRQDHHGGEAAVHDPGGNVGRIRCHAELPPGREHDVGREDPHLQQQAGNVHAARQHHEDRTGYHVPGQPGPWRPATNDRSRTVDRGRIGGRQRQPGVPLQGVPDGPATADHRLPHAHAATCWAAAGSGDQPARARYHVSRRGQHRLLRFASDPEDGPLAASHLTWEVLFHH